MTHYPGAELALWKYQDAAGNPAYFRGINRPIAVVLHVAQGWASTARAWAAAGHSTASWHYFVCKDGTVLQQLEHEDGGYHAGIASPPAPTPTWPLWKGSHLNINCYTIGIEHEGFSGDGFTELQRVASRDLCRWLASELGFPYDREHFPAHAEIDLINRPSDFGSPAYREEIYKYLFEEDEMTKEDMVALFGSTERDPLTGRLLSVEERYPNAKDRYDEAVATGKSLLEQVGQSGANLKSHIDGHTTGSAEAEHSHSQYVLKAELAEASD